MYKRYFFIFILATVWENTFAQQKISVAYNNDPLSFVIEDLQAKTKTGKMLPDACLCYAKPVTYSAKKEPVDTVLKKILEGQPLDFLLYSNNIIYVPKPVYGRVTNERGEPLAEVTVQSEISITKTDTNGNFILKQAACDYILKCTHISMEPHTELLRGRLQIDITLKQRIDTLLQQEFNNGYEEAPKKRAPQSLNHKAYNYIKKCGVPLPFGAPGLAMVLLSVKPLIKDSPENF